MVRNGQDVIHPFLTSHGEWYRSYVYNICEHLKFITIAVLMWQGVDPKYYKTDRLFVILAVADFADYLITGNNLWARLDLIPAGDGFGFTLPLSMNSLTFVIFGIAIYKYAR